MKKWLIVFLIIFALCSVAFAGPSKKRTNKKQTSSTEHYIAKGSQEIAPSMTITRDFGVTEFDFTVGYGYFVTHFIKPEVEFSFGLVKASGFDIDTQLFLFGASLYYNEGNKIIPFFGFKLGVGSGEASGSVNSVRSTSFITSMRPGFLLWLNKNVNLSFPVEYQRWSFGKQGVGASNHIRVPIGLSILF